MTPDLPAERLAVFASDGTPLDEAATLNSQGIDSRSVLLVDLFDV